VSAEQEKQAQVRAREAQMKEDDDSDGINFSDEDSDEEDEATRLARLAQSWATATKIQSCWILCKNDRLAESCAKMN